MKFRILYIFLIFCQCLPGLYGQAEGFQNALLPPDSSLFELLAAPGIIGIDGSEVPNVFTPNNDNLNDYFVVATSGTQTYVLRIFTRAGTQVFYSESPSIIWDGRTSGGLEVPEGLYLYVIELPGKKPGKGLTGFLYLFR